jgi:hypothetical protein
MLWSCYTARHGEGEVHPEEFGSVIVIRRIGHRKEVYAKTVQREITRTIRQKRSELTSMREEIEGRIDYLNLLEARARNAGKPTASHADMLKKYGLK